MTLSLSLEVVQPKLVFLTLLSTFGDHSPCWKEVYNVLPKSRDLTMKSVSKKEFDFELKFEFKLRMWEQILSLKIINF